MGHIIGYDVNERYGQISFYGAEATEPETMEQIPLVIGLRGDLWVIGNEASEILVC